jgi:hypothetical protein
MRLLTLALTSLVLTSVVLTPALAHAAPAAAPDEATRARDLFQAAQKLYKANKFAEAIAKFEEALAAKPHPVIHFNLARCYEQLGEPAKALRSYRDYLRLSPDAKDKDQVTATMGTLEKKLSAKGLQQLLVVCETEGARAEVDGKDIGKTPASIELVAGDHKLVVRADGYDPVEKSFTFSTAHISEQAVTLSKATAKNDPPPPPPLVDAPKKDDGVALTPNNNGSSGNGGTGVNGTAEPVKKPRVFTWIAAGVAVAAAGGATGLYFVADKPHSDLINPNTVRTRAENDALVAQVKANEGLYMGSAITYGVAGAALVTAVVLFILEK